MLMHASLVEAALSTRCCFHILSTAAAADAAAAAGLQSDQTVLATFHSAVFHIKAEMLDGDLVPISTSCCCCCCCKA